MSRKNAETRADGEIVAENVRLIAEQTAQRQAARFV